MIEDYGNCQTTNNNLDNSKKDYSTNLEKVSFNEVFIDHVRQNQDFNIEHLMNFVNSNAPDSIKAFDVVSELSEPKEVLDLVINCTKTTSPIITYSDSQLN
jgi:hypothetical protein